MFDIQKKLLITQLSTKGINNKKVLKIMGQVSRHDFVHSNQHSQAYLDTALPISCQQTISQPFIVAFMTEILLQYTSSQNIVLEIGTGSSYQAYILSFFFKKVITVERIQPLYKQAQICLKNLKANNVFCKLRDGNQGSPEDSPFDAIIITAACENIPLSLLKQLRDGGILLAPINNGFGSQNLTLYFKQGDTISNKKLIGVIFVPMLKGIIENK
jgi:protein-L-isoaspartate(D-aspartate) O-methyltransferase